MWSQRRDLYRRGMPRHNGSSASDARHITFQDVHDLAAMMTVEFNIEGYPSRSF